MDALRLARRSRKQRKEERRMNPLMRFCRNVPKVVGLFCSASLWWTTSCGSGPAALRIDPGTGGGGAPTSYTSRSDRNVQQEAALSTPSVNTVINDPDFLVDGTGARIVRVTDGNTGSPCSLPANQSFFSTSSAEQNTWNTDSTKFYMESSGGRVMAVTLDSTTMQSSFINVPRSCWVPLFTCVDAPTVIYSKPNYLS